MTPTLLLLGGRGQVGWELQRSLAPLGKLVVLDRLSREYCGDLTDLDGLRQTVRTVRPAAIINAAAYTRVDEAETACELAQRVNALAPQALAQVATEVGAWLIHYSTDYVFDGSGDRPWCEDDIPAPLNAYGRSKLDGERLITQACERHLILRTSWVYAARAGNFIKNILRLATEREQLSVIDDQWGAPTSAELLADITAHALRQVMIAGAGQGIYHLAAAGETSWYRYACYLIDTVRRGPLSHELKVQTIIPVSTDEFPARARRPLNSRLDTSKLRNGFGVTLPSWQCGVDRILAESFRH